MLANVTWQRIERIFFLVSKFIFLDLVLELLPFFLPLLLVKILLLLVVFILFFHKIVLDLIILFDFIKEFVNIQSFHLFFSNKLDQLLNVIKPESLGFVNNLTLCLLIDHINRKYTSII